MQIRPASLDDLPAVARIHVETWQAAYRGHVPDWFLDALSVDERADEWTEILGQGSWPSTGLLVAETDHGELVGFAHLSPSRDDDATADCGEVTAIYVDPSAWRTGAGRLLLEASSSLLREAGFSRATLWVLEGNDRARCFYERLGWRTDGSTKIDDRGDFTLTEVRYATTLV